MKARWVLYLGILIVAVVAYGRNVSVVEAVWHIDSVTDNPTDFSLTAHTWEVLDPGNFSYEGNWKVEWSGISFAGLPGGGSVVASQGGSLSHIIASHAGEEANNGVLGWSGGAMNRSVTDPTTYNKVYTNTISHGLHSDAATVAFGYVLGTVGAEAGLYKRTAVVTAAHTGGSAEVPEMPTGVAIPLMVGLGFGLFWLRKRISVRA